MKIYAPTLLATFLIASSAALADIEKIAIPSESGLRFYWWPKVTPLSGWHRDREHSFHYSVNALAPDGFTFANAATVMYAKAVYKPREPDVKSLEMLIAKDKRNFLAAIPDIVIEEAATLTTADGQKLRTFTFFPKSQGNWERVAYAEEGEFYVVFTLSSRTVNGYKDSLRAFEQLVAQYREKP
jgi:hypothetical protein